MTESEPKKSDLAVWKGPGKIDREALEKALKDFGLAVSRELPPHLRPPFVVKNNPNKRYN